MHRHDAPDTNTSHTSPHTRHNSIGVGPAYALMTCVLRRYTLPVQISHWGYTVEGLTTFKGCVTILSR